MDRTSVMMTTLRQIAVALALVFISAVLAEVPPMPVIVTWIQEREWHLLLATGGIGVIGFTLMMGGILQLLMDQDHSLGRSDVEDVERSVRLAARPVTWRASSYRVYGSSAGRQGSERFTLGELKRAWRSGAIRHDSVWKRRFVTMTGAFLFAAGLLGGFVVLGPAWVKVLVGGAMLYATGMISRGFWRA